MEGQTGQEKGKKSRLRRCWATPQAAEGLTQLDRDGLRFGVVLQSIFTVFAALARHLEAAEWRGRVDNVVTIHPNGAGFYGLGIGVRLVDVLRENGGSQAVVRSVGTIDDLFHALERKHAYNWAEDFVLGNGHLVLHIIKDRRLHEVTVAPMALAAQQEFRAFLLADVAVFQNLVHLLVRNLRYLFGAGIQRVAELAPLGFCRQPINEFLVNLLLDKEPRAGGAALAAMEVDGVESAVYGLFHVGIGEDHVRALAAQFKGHALECVGGALLNDLCGIDVTGECDFINIRMDHDGVTGGLTETIDQVDHPRRETGFDSQLADAESRERRLLGRLHDDRAACRQGGTPLPRQHEQGKVPRDNLPDDADRLPEGVRKEAAANRHGFPFDLVGPTGVITQCV